MIELSKGSLIILIGGIAIILITLFSFFLFNASLVANTDYGGDFLLFREGYANYPKNSNYNYFDQWKHAIILPDKCPSIESINCRDGNVSRPFIKDKGGNYGLGIVIMLLVFGCTILLYHSRNNELISTPTKVQYLIFLLFIFLSIISVFIVLNQKIPTVPATSNIEDIPEPDAVQAKNNDLSEALFGFAIGQQVVIGIIILALIIRLYFYSKL